MDVSGFNLSDSFVAQAPSTSGAAESGGVCSQCGFTLAKFQQTGRLGCSRCYLTFSDEILSRLGPMHRGLRHFGKHPKDFEGDAFSERLLIECKERLDQAVKAENYEEAARIRDEISKLEKGEPAAVEQSEEPSAQVGGDSAL